MGNEAETGQDRTKREERETRVAVPHEATTVDTRQPVQVTKPKKERKKRDFYSTPPLSTVSYNTTQQHVNLSLLLCAVNGKEEEGRR